MDLTDNELAEHNKNVMKRLHDENLHLTDTQTIKLMADKFLDAVKKSGDHFCLHEKDWGLAISELKSIKENQVKHDEGNREILKELIEAKNNHAARITTLETTHKVVAGIFGAFLVIWTAGKLIFK